jgi:hypothetical protein
VTTGSALRRRVVSVDVFDVFCHTNDDGGRRGMSSWHVVAAVDVGLLHHVAPCTTSRVARRRVWWMRNHRLDNLNIFQFFLYFSCFNMFDFFCFLFSSPLYFRNSSVLRFSWRYWRGRFSAPSSHARRVRQRIIEPHLNGFEWSVEPC